MKNEQRVSIANHRTSHCFDSTKMLTFRVYLTHTIWAPFLTIVFFCSIEFCVLFVIVFFLKKSKKLSSKVENKWRNIEFPAGKIRVKWASY